MMLKIKPKNQESMPVPSAVPSVPIVGNGERFVSQELPVSREALREMREISQGQYFSVSVSVSQYYSPALFYLVLRNKMEEFTEMSRALSTYYESEGWSLEIPVEALKVSRNLVVAAPYLNFGYHRAEVRNYFWDVGSPSPTC